MSDAVAIPNPSEGDFDRFLMRLDQNRDRAAEKYEDIRRLLVKFFEWNYSARAEELADRALVVLQQKVQYEEIENLNAYARAVARNIGRDAFREAEKIVTEETPNGLDSLGDPKWGLRDIENEIDDQIRSICLRRCRAQLQSEDDMLVIEYYSADGETQKSHRKKLALRIGITRNALAVRANRIRERLEKCVNQCLENRRRALAKAYGGGQP